MPMHKVGGKPKRLKQRHYIYDLVKNTDIEKKPQIQMILTQYVEGLGDRGDKVSMSPLRAYNKLLLTGLGVYLTPENIKKYDVENDNRGTTSFSSPYVPRTMSILKQYLLNVVMSLDTPWTLEKWHVRSAFRKAGIYLNDDTITMPQREIKGPNLEIENKEFYVTVTINKQEQVKVRCRIHHWTNDKTVELPFIPEFYLKQSEAIFPEDKIVLDEMPPPYLMKKDMEKQKTGNETITQ